MKQDEGMGEGTPCGRKSETLPTAPTVKDFKLKKIQKPFQFYVNYKFIDKYIDNINGLNLTITVYL